MRFLAALPALALAACVPGAAGVQPATLAVRYPPGDQQAYHLHEVFTGALTNAAGQVQPVTFDLRAAESTRVTAVDPDGTATLEVELTGVTGTSNGQALPPLGTQTDQVRVATDGRVLGGGAGGGGSTTTVPSADQWFAILPDRKVAPGATWTRDFERANPFGPGSLKVHSASQLLRYEQAGGVRTAVVQSQLGTPVDVDLAQAPAGGAVAHEKGSVSADVTSWLDPAAARIVKTSARTRFDLAVNVASSTGTATYTLTGSQTVDLERTG